MLKDKLAKRYVFALMKSLDVSQYEDVLAELLAVLAIIDNSSDLKIVLGSPNVNYQEKEKIADAIFKKLKFNEMVMSFFKVLIKHNRIEIISKIVDIYQVEIYKKIGKVKVSVASSVKVSEQLKTKFSEVFSEYTGKQIELSVSHDPALLAGLVATIGDNVIDASLLGQLQKMKKELVNNN